MHKDIPGTLESFLWNWNLKFSPDSKKLFEQTERFASLWDVKTGNLVNKIESAVSYFYSSIGEIAAINNGKLSVYNPIKLNKSIKFNNPPIIPFSLEFSPRGEILIAEYKNTVRIWDPYANKLLKTYKSHENIRYIRREKGH